MLRSFSRLEGARIMKRHTAREWTVEEFDDWAAASDRFEAVATRRRTRRAGRAFRWCPRPSGTRSGRRTYCRRPRRSRPETPKRPATPPVPATPFDGVALEDSRKRLAGWSAERQRLFLCHSRRDRLGPSRQRRRAPFRALGLSAARPLAGLRRGLGHGGPARRGAALRSCLRSRHQRPHRAGLARGRFGRGEAPAERPAADVRL